MRGIYTHWFIKRLHHWLVSLQRQERGENVEFAWVADKSVKNVRKQHLAMRKQSCKSAVSRSWQNIAQLRCGGCRSLRLKKKSWTFSRRTQNEPPGKVFRERFFVRTSIKLSKLLISCLSAFPRGDFGWRLSHTFTGQWFM